MKNGRDALQSCLAVEQGLSLRADAPTEARRPTKHSIGRVSKNTRRSA